MKKKVILCIVATVIIASGVVLKIQFDHQEYVLTEDEQKTIDSKLEQHPDIEFTKIVGRTYQVYYSDQMTYLVGDEEAAIKAIEKLQKQQEKTK
ncbi:hypothetical protein [Turicibacter sanguinis]|uniref:hypothetical protein n=1 Tax=Turicibacter sanguinis TaxID=154288 RepID=UPI0021D4C941|nr:hypothetical protein [Turicibacter sanguinis]MCU7196951.1 hypothetical protein [Turicibacter sanguinis]